jgi:hypothetical protein
MDGADGTEASTMIAGSRLKVLQAWPITGA